MMTLTKHTTYLPFILSVLLHGMIAGLLGMYVTFSTPSPIVLGKNLPPALTTYLQPMSTQQTIAQEHTQAIEPKLKLNLATKTQRIFVTRPKTRDIKKASVTQHSSPSMQAQSNQTISELTALLHAAIQAQQHYPEMALAMAREGKITLRFRLFTNGEIKNLQMVKSSGTTSLDEAALTAVRKAAPFQAVDKYLHSPQDYQLDVVFELT